MKARILTLLFGMLILGSATSAFAGNGDALLKYTPDDTRVLLALDVAAIRGSHAMNGLVESLNESSQFRSIQATLKEAGFEPTEQIETLVAAATSTRASARPLIIAQGAFPRAALEEKLRAEEKATVTEIDGHAVFVVPDRGATTFLADNILAVGPRELVEAAIRNKSRSAPSYSSRVRALVDAADHSRNLWIATQSVQNSRVEGTSYSQARGAAISVNLATDLDLTAKLVTSSAEAAQAIANDISTQLATAKQRDEVAALGLTGIIDAASVSTSGSNAVVTVKLEQGRWNRLFNTLQSIVREQLR